MNSLIDDPLKGYYGLPALFVYRDKNVGDGSIDIELLAIEHYPKSDFAVVRKDVWYARLPIIRFRVKSPYILDPKYGRVYLEEFVKAGECFDPETHCPEK